MKKILLVIALTGIGFGAWAQTSSCAQTLRLAQSIYDQGRLHELEDIVNKGILAADCDKQTKVSLHKLLTLAYIYLEEPAKADAEMLKLLSTDHYFEINESVDPAEFVALYETFRRDPVYSIGLKLGGGLTFPLLISDYYTTSGSEGTGKYSPGLGFMGGFSFEKKIKKQWILAPEILLASRTFSSESKLFFNDLTQQAEGSIVSTYNQTWIDLNPMVQYVFGSGTFKTYLTAGPGISYNIGSTKQTVTTGLSNSSVSGPDTDLKSSTNSFLFSLSAGAGIKYRIGDIIVQAEIRYQQALNNTFNVDSRTNIENVTDYGDQLNDVILTSLFGTLGVSYPIFKPEKLKK
jgi:hypothetical protein